MIGYGAGAVPGGICKGGLATTKLWAQKVNILRYPVVLVLLPRLSSTCYVQRMGQRIRIYSMEIEDMEDISLRLCCQRKCPVSDYLMREG